MSNKPAIEASEALVIDKRYIRNQVKQALKAYVAPLSGVYAAAFGPLTPVEPSAPNRPVRIR